MKYELIELSKKVHKFNKCKVIFTDDDGKRSTLGPFLNKDEAREYSKLHRRIQLQKKEERDYPLQNR